MGNLGSCFIQLRPSFHPSHLIQYFYATQWHEQFVELLFNKICNIESIYNISWIILADENYKVFLYDALFLMILHQWTNSDELNRDNNISKCRLCIYIIHTELSHTVFFQFNSLCTIDTSHELLGMRPDLMQFISYLMDLCGIIFN